MKLPLSLRAISTPDDSLPPRAQGRETDEKDVIASDLPNTKLVEWIGRATDPNINRTMPCAA
jgi:hypothetical protein